MEENQIISKNEQERRERLRNSRARKIKRLAIWIAVLAVIGAGIYGMVKWSSKQSAGKPGVAIPELGRDHIAAGAQHDPYNSNPPTSGPHYAQAADWGFYEEPLPDEQLIHNLEHGGIWISYKKPDDSELEGQLKAISEKYSLKVIITPRAENDSPIAAAAWGRLLKLDSFDRDQIEDFIKTFINKGPEQTPY
ncbi:MAG: DUF3105 domain-containing protein [Candidatus Doudnabacteria bacterium]|nr:DUF3105 domain-containing protein [bacterium]MDZ4243548.1 DUF3105 domain-containing protein [Candidatus Doudnabacteria bacterium]